MINGVTDKTPSTTDFCTSPCPGLSSCSVQTADSFFSTLAKKSAHSAIRLAWRVTTTLKTTTTKTKNIKSRATTRQAWGGSDAQLRTANLGVCSVMFPAPVTSLESKHADYERLYSLINTTTLFIRFPLQWSVCVCVTVCGSGRWMSWPSVRLLPWGDYIAALPCDQ